MDPASPSPVVWESPRPDFQPFSSLEKAREAYKAFAKENHFIVTCRRTTQHGSKFNRHTGAVMQCHRGRLYEQHSHLTSENRQRQRTSAGTLCPYDVRIVPNHNGTEYYCNIWHNVHNHAPLASPRHHHEGRRLPPNLVAQVTRQIKAGFGAASIIQLLRHEGIKEENMPLLRDIYNIRRSVRRAAAAAATNAPDCDNHTSDVEVDGDAAEEDDYETIKEVFMKVTYKKKRRPHEEHIISDVQILNSHETLELELANAEMMKKKRKVASQDKGKANEDITKVTQTAQSSTINNIASSSAIEILAEAQKAGEAAAAATAAKEGASADDIARAFVTATAITIARGHQF